MKQNNLRILVCISILFIVVVAESRDEYLNSENAVEKASKCNCKGGECIPDKKGNPICTCPEDYGLYSKTECRKCDCGKESSCKWTTVFLVTTKTCICKKGYEKGILPWSNCYGTCKDNPCESGGSCKVKDDDIECTCKPQYEGKFCEKKKVTTVKPTTTTIKKKTTYVISSTIQTKPYTHPRINTTSTTTRKPTSTVRFITNTTNTTTRKPTTTVRFITNTTNTTTRKPTATVRLITNTTMQETTKQITQKKTSPRPVSYPPSSTKKPLSTTYSVRSTKVTTRSTTDMSTPTASPPTRMYSGTSSKSTRRETEPVTITKSFTDGVSNITSTDELLTSISNNTEYTPGTGDYNETSNEINGTGVITEELVTFTSNYSDSTSEGNGTETTTSGLMTTIFNNTEYTTGTGYYNETTNEINGTDVITDELVTFTSNYSDSTAGGNNSETTVTEIVTEIVYTSSKLITTHPRDKTTITTIPRVCLCKNGGTCVDEGKYELRCLCPYPYAGKTCTESYWCSEGEGKDLCGSAKCVFNFVTEVGHCACPKAFYFDYHNKSCQLVDLCPLQPERCKSGHELCIKNECVCEENFKRNEQHECIPNFCEKHGDICAKYNATCKENEEDPENVKCVCKENEVFNGEVCVKANKCDLPSILGCQQICNSSSEKCACYEGFNLEKDGKSCKLTEKGPLPCNESCSPGICAQYNESETCLCPPTHVNISGSCEDLCSAKLLPKNLCPGDACEPDPTLGFRCKCDGKLTYEENNVTCRRKLMCSEGIGNETCSNRSAKCIDDFDLEGGFTCICESNEEMDLDGVCKLKCDLKSYQENCWGKRASCEMDGDEAICKCPPLLKMGKNKYCEDLDETSYMGLLPILKKNQKTAMNGSIVNSPAMNEFSTIKQTLRDSMRLIFGENYKFADILNCSDSGDFFNCMTEIQFKSDPKGQINLIADADTCIRNGPFSCYIPPAFVLNTRKLKPDLLSRSDPCSKEIKLMNCGGQETVCNSTEDKSSYQCTCSEGFRSYSVLYPVADRTTVIHRCEDINECLIPRACPNRTRCINTYGSYDCSCQQGDRPISPSADPKISGCVGVCEKVSCGNGKCVVDGTEYRCKCDESYSGEKCDKKLELGGRSKGAEVALIVLSTTVVPLLLFALYMVQKNRILSRKVSALGYLDDGSSTISMEPLRP